MVKTQAEFTVREAAAILDLDHKVVGNWILRHFVTPTRSEKRGKRKHVHFFNYSELLWMGCLRLLAVNLTMEYSEVVPWKKAIMQHAAERFAIGNGEATWIAPLKFWSETKLKLTVDGKLKMVEGGAGEVRVHLHHLKMFIDQQIEKLGAE